jgi:hypothetical protein
MVKVTGVNGKCQSSGDQLGLGIKIQSDKKIGNVKYDIINNSMLFLRH